MTTNWITYKKGSINEMKDPYDDANGKAFCAHVFENLTLLKFLYYSK